MKVYDQHGTERSWDWVRQKYGQVSIVSPRPGSLYRVVTFHEVEGPTALTVAVLDDAGYPVDDQDVVFYWPDAPGAPGAGHHEHGRIGATNYLGDVGFGMGPGAYYDPHPTVPNPQLDTVGPHSVWVHGDSEMVEGLGMLAGTNHTHLNVVYQFMEESEPEPEPEPPPHPDPWPPEPPPEPEPEPTPPPDHPQHWWTLFNKLDRIIELLGALVEG